MTNSDFSTFGFAIGQVRGARRWRITEDGYLCGMYHRQKWTLGENLALCRKIESTAYGYHPKGSQPVNTTARQTVCMADSDDGFDPPDANHLDHHDCGFYGFYDGSNDYPVPSVSAEVMAGVIEGSGLCLIGPRGFRCTKARIVALLMETPEYQGRIPRHYFGVPIFNSFDRMLEEFPCEGKPDITVEAVEG